MEWKEYILEDVVDKFIDYRGKTPKKTTSGIPLVTAKIVKNGSIEKPNEFIAPEDYDAWMTRGLPMADDIVLTTEAPLGQVALIEDASVALAQRIITIRGNPKYVYNPFLKYYLQSPIGQYKLRIRSSGSTVSGIKSSVLKKTAINLPILSTQRDIAHTLSLLDAKINLLHRQNQTLEALGAAVFREWFLEGELVGSVEEVATHLKKSVKPQNNPDTQYKHYSLPAYDAGKRPVAEDGSDIRSGKYEVVDQCILVSKLNPRFPRVWLIDRASTDAICSTEFQVFKPEDLNYLSFLYFFFLSPFAKNSLVMAASGTSGSHQRVRPSDILSLEFNYNSYEQILAFDEFATPLLNKVQQNNYSILELERTRDLLLPKLMSGQVTVRP